MWFQRNFNVIKTWLKSVISRLISRCQPETQFTACLIKCRLFKNVFCGICSFAPRLIRNDFRALLVYLIVEISHSSHYIQWKCKCSSKRPKKPTHCHCWRFSREFMLVNQSSKDFSRFCGHNINHITFNEVAWALQTLREGVIMQNRLQVKMLILKPHAARKMELVKFDFLQQ